KRIRARILTDSGNAELDTESIVPSLQHDPHITTFAQLAALLDHAERAILSKEYAQDRSENLTLIGLAAYCLLKEASGRNSIPPFREFLENYRTNSLGAPLPDTDRGPFSTEQMFEAHALLVEQFYL